MIDTLKVYSLSRKMIRQNQQTAKVVTSKDRAGLKKIQIQIVAIYNVDVQTGINVTNFLPCMLNSTEYGIYPSQNVKMQ